MPKKIEISHRTIIFTFFFIVLLWFLYTIREVIFQVFVALLIMTILNPTVTKLHRMKIPRAVSVVIVYFLVLALIILSLYGLIPPLIEQTTSFANSLPSLFRELNIPPHIVQQIEVEFGSQLSTLPSQAIKIGVSIFSNVLTVITIFIFALYFLLAREKLEEHLSSFFKDHKAQRISKVIDKLEQKLGGWARGELILMFVVGLATYVGLLILGIPFALPLALFAGILEIIPNVGPIVAAISPIIVGFGISPITGLGAAALGFIIQQVENYALVPKVMEKSAGVSPILTLLSLIIGLKIAGIAGAILSVPVVITSQVILEEFVFSK